MRAILAKLFYWKLALWKGTVGILIVVLASLPQAILNWDSMTPNGRAVAVIGIALTVVKWLDGFVDKTIASLGRKPEKTPDAPDGLSAVAVAEVVVKPAPAAPPGIVQRLLARILARPLQSALNGTVALLILTATVLLIHH